MKIKIDSLSNIHEAAKTFLANMAKAKSLPSTARWEQARQHLSRPCVKN